MRIAVLAAYKHISARRARPAAICGVLRMAGLQRIERAARRA